MTRTLNNLTVLGGGVLGGQIAFHSAFKGKTVVVFDKFDQGLEQCRAAHDTYAGIYLQDVGASQEQLEQTWSRISYTTDLKSAVAEADLVIEAVPEVPEIKTALYQEMAPLLPEHTLVATNSSSLLARDFAQATGRPEQFAAMHYANLLWQNPTLEIMGHPQVARETIAGMVRFALETDMVPIPVQKEQNGYVLNSWLIPMLTACESLVTNGVTTPEMVDRTYLMANRGASMGPFGILDIVGIETAHNIAAYWGEVQGDEQLKKNAAWLKEQYLDKGKTGAMAGEGFYKYPNPAYAEPEFLAVPDISKVDELADLIMP